MHSKLMYLSWRAFFLSALFFLFGPSDAKANDIVIPSTEVMNYCALAGCDSQVFYRYYQTNSERFCAESNVIRTDSKLSKIFNFVLKRSIEKELPPTVSVLPILESSLNPKAVASTHKNSAKGLWQLKPETAKDMGLEVSGVKDERMDMILSTEAGLGYIDWLEKRFDGDHNLAVLAYHVGIGRVKRMINQYNTENPWFLSRLISSKHPDKDYLLKYYSYSLALMRKGC